MALPAPRGRSSAIRRRLASAVVGLPILLSMIYVGGWYYVAGVLICAVWSALEVVSMGRRAGHAPAAPIVVGGTAALTVAPLVPAAGPDTPATIAIAAVILAGLGYLIQRSGTGDAALMDALLTIGGALYLGVLFGYLTALRLLPHGQG
ncbi:MAG TPA: phosphatidate cytidylyltransferase, partial [Dehalococcoidia bacterium]|nr:phosphatidate cytidylyltransferase [Dehalococcoidia bacterium]